MAEVRFDTSFCTPAKGGQLSGNRMCEHSDHGSVNGKQSDLIGNPVYLKILFLECTRIKYFHVHLLRCGCLPHPIQFGIYFIQEVVLG